MFWGELTEPEQTYFTLSFYSLKLFSSEHIWLNMEARRDLQPWLWCFFYPCVSFNNAAKLRGTDASNPTITWLKTQFLCTLSRYRLPAALSFSCRFLKGKQVWNGKVCFIVYNESYLRCLAVTGQTIKNHIQSQESMTWLMTDRGVGRWDKTVSGVYVCEQMLCE